MRVYSIIIILCLIVILSLVGCGGSGGGGGSLPVLPTSTPTSIPTTSVTRYIYAPSLKIGVKAGEVPFTIMVSEDSVTPSGYTPLSNATVSVKDNTSLSALTDTSGKFILNVPIGIVDLNISHPDYSQIFQYLLVNSQQGTGDNKPVSDFKIIPDSDVILAKLGASAYFQLSSYAKNSSGAVINPSVTWSVNDPNAAITENGLFSSNKNGTYIVTATSKDNSSLNSSLTVRVEDKIITIRGTVKNSSGTAMSSALVRVNGANQCCLTDASGNYTIYVPYSSQFTLTATASTGTLTFTGSTGSVNVTITNPNQPTEANITISGSGTPFPTSTPTAQGSVSPTKTPIVANTPTPSTQIISPPTGGTITYGGASVAFKVNSVTSTVTVTASLENNYSIPSISPSGYLYNFSLSSSSAYDPNTPATITLPITIDPNTAGLAIYHSSDKSTWNSIGGTVSGQYITANVPSFSYFVVGKMPTWKKLSYNPPATLLGVHFVDTNNGWAVGDSGTIVHTANGGSSWDVQTSNTTNYLRSVYFANSSNGWAVGDSGIVLNTTNGGTTWAKTTATSNTLNKVCFIDSNNGWAVGNSGTIIRTSNGGSTWSPQDPNTTGNLYSIYFTNSNNGWAVGEYGTILVTTNGGSMWTKKTSGTTTDLKGVHFVDSSNGWAVGSSTLLKTTNGGNTWTTTTSNIYYARDVQFLDVNNGWILDYNTPCVYYTTNGGSTWVQQFTFNTSYIYDFYFTDINTGWAVYGYIYKYSR